MKLLTNRYAYESILIISTSILIFSGCQKQIDQPRNQDQLNAVARAQDHGHLKQTNTYSSDVVIKWINMQLRLMQTSSPFIGGLPVSRVFGYTGIALYESVVPGMPAYQSLSGQLNQFPDRPKTEPGFAYYWPANANAAIAAMTRSFFPTASAANKVSIDSLENALNNEYKNSVSTEELQRSVAFGKSVAQLVFDWAKTDGADHANDAYTSPVGLGLWEPLATPTGPQVAFGPYWKNNRLLVAGSLNGANVPAPPTYSTDPSSDFYKMVKEVYDVSQSLTPEQRATGLYYRDNPGYGGGHYMSILKLVLQQEQATLDISALAFAKAGIAAVDAGIGCWKVKYDYNNLRPITYIRNVMGYTSWNPLFGTPPFPDYISGHSTIAGAVAEVLTSMFGDNYHLTNNSYSFLGMPNQHYSSFYDMADQIGKSRVYAGIHYTISCTEGNKLGQKVARNILNALRFKKD
jgi:hypothetical protein